MPFKLERSWFGSFTSARKSAALALALAGVLGGVDASATISISAANNNNISQTLSNSNVSTYFYPMTNSSGNLASTLDNDPLLPPLLSSTSDAGAPGSNLMVFNVSSSTPQFTPPTGGTNPRILLIVLVNGGSKSLPVPITYYNPTLFGGGGLGSCYSSGQCDQFIGCTVPSLGGNCYYGVPYPAANNPNVTVQVGINPFDVCQAIGSTLGGTTPCSGGNLAPFVAPPGALPQMSLTFEIVPFNGPAIDPNQFNAGVGTSATMPGMNGVADSNAVTVDFQNSGPTALSCPPDAATYNNVYNPGDGQILLNTNYFGLGTQPGYAPAGSLIVVASGPNAAAGGTPNVTVPAGPIAAAGQGYLSNSLVVRVPFGIPGQGVGGFTNATGDNNYYGVSFLGRDLAGFVVPPGPDSGATTNCYITNVRTSQILGFLSKSNCFIATAAFRSVDAAPVALLRRFRDQVLLRSGFGRKFVRWYYRWSPPAAEWLILHPEFRYPVLVALVPLEILAWLCVNPILLLTFACVVFSAVLLIFLIRRHGFGRGARA